MNYKNEGYQLVTRRIKITLKINIILYFKWITVALEAMLVACRSTWHPELLRISISTILGENFYKKCT